MVELETLSSKGDSQSELVMFVMLRLVEDVAVLQTLEQNQRRKEIYQALTSHMETIFKFLLTLLERHYQVSVFNLKSRDLSRFKFQGGHSKFKSTLDLLVKNDHQVFFFSYQNYQGSHQNESYFQSFFKLTIR